MYNSRLYFIKIILGMPLSVEINVITLHLALRNITF